MCAGKRREDVEFTDLTAEEAEQMEEVEQEATFAEDQPGGAREGILWDRLSFHVCPPDQVWTRGQSYQQAGLAGVPSWP